MMQNSVHDSVSNHINYIQVHLNTTQLQICSLGTETFEKIFTLQIQLIYNVRQGDFLTSWQTLEIPV